MASSKKSKEVNRVSAYGSTPIQAAVHSNNIQTVSILLSKKADPNLTEKPTGETALHRAVLNQNIDIVRMLLGANAKIDECGLYGSALHLAAIRNMDIVLELLKNNASVDLDNIDGKSPVYVAAFGKYFDIVKVLVENNADISRDYGNDGETILHIAMRKEKFDVVDGLLKLEMKELDLDIGDDKGNTPLHLSGKHYKTMKKLLECGANPNCQNADGNTPLHLAIEWDWNFIETLLDHGAIPDILNELGQTPLMKAAVKSKEILENMINHIHYSLKNKKGRQFVRDIQANESISQEIKDFLVEKQNQQRATKKSKKSVE